MTSRSMATGSGEGLAQSDRHRNRPVTRITCVSTGKPGTPNALPNTTFAVLRPTPGRLTSEAISAGTSPPNRTHNSCDSPMILRAFVRKKPMVRMMSSTCSGFAAASSAGPGYSPNSSGRDHVHALVGGLRAQHRSHQQFERRIEVQRAFRIGNLHAQLLVFLMHARDPRLLRFPRHASQPTPRMRTNAGNLRKRRNRQKQRKSIEKTTENQQKTTGNQRKTTGNQRKANENKRNPSNINGMIARKSQLSPDSP